MAICFMLFADWARAAATRARRMSGNSKANRKPSRARISSNSKTLKAGRRRAMASLPAGRRVRPGTRVPGRKRLSCSGLLQHVEVGERATEDGVAVAVEPLVEQRRI